MKIKYFSLSLFLSLLYFQASAQCNSAVIFANDSTPANCFFIDGNVRTIYTNNLPDHSYGSWASGNQVLGQELTFHMCAYPQKAATFTTILGGDGSEPGCSDNYEFGMGANGIRFAPFGARWFVNPNTQEENKAWNAEPTVLFNMDLNGAHSNGGGEYHYHGIADSYYTDSLKIDGSAHSPLVAYAADGFPVYYKYTYTNPNDPTQGISAFTSGYSLKMGNRLGDGITAPNGPYDGLYVEDYAYTSQSWDLDSCNGRFGITPEYPQGTYYYVLTDNFPYIPRCLYGTVLDNTFRVGGRCAASSASVDCSANMTSIIAQVEESEIKIAPNPATHSISIFSDKPELLRKITGISIYDMTGKTCFTATEVTTSIDISSLAPGTYFMQIDFQEAQLTQKLVVR